MDRAARLIVLGKQGSGKGTQCVRISQHYGIPHISTGDMLRAAVKSGSSLGARVQSTMEAGELVSDDIILEVMAARLAEDDAARRGFVLDGFPRTVGQADRLDEILKPSAIDVVVSLEIPTSVVVGRIAQRRTCSVCGRVYATSAPPKVDWTCDACGGEVVQREDDTEEAVTRRLALYDAQTAPLIARYATAGRLVPVDANGSVEEVAARLLALVEARLGAGGVGA
ncbi:MAG: adenylate kinase [Acidimicrobiales bacterium]|jgi:adenylate kinase